MREHHAPCVVPWVWDVPLDALPSNSDEEDDTPATDIPKVQPLEVPPPPSSHAADGAKTVTC